jgi:outer membrane murein-binding lipoprotein Lpp
MQRDTFTVAILLVTTLVPAGSANAQEARGGGGANAALVQQLQQLASDRTDLQAQNAKLQKDLETMRHDRDALKSGQASADRRAQQSESAVHQIQQDAAVRQKAADENVARWKEQLDQLVGKYRELAQTLRDTETDRNTLQQKIATQERTLSVCADDNASLYNLNTEVLDHFEHPSVFAGLIRAEPFTQLARIRLENAALEYRQRAQELKVRAAQGKTGDKTGT